MLMIIIMMMFSFDVFGGDESFVKQLLGFLIHNIPALLFIIALIIAWRYEIAGGIMFFVLFIAAGIFFKSFSGNAASLIIIVPFAVAGISFISHDILSRRGKLSQQNEKIPD